ncbi:hypothetical protein DFH07DRAFT_772597 [Mycena maculata]|uniref:Uncharacterized protein n=1 Tax=Mycena maculata TaxID=230809 RepID=A0AAD7NFK0_9AGAR|nr:hypothetical protein DFH07DRAFT_772597 [Mycena maculata]
MPVFDTTRFLPGPRKIAAAEEALAGFASSVHASSAVVPVQLDITDETSIRNAYAFISSYLTERNILGLDRRGFFPIVQRNVRGQCLRHNCRDRSYAPLIKNGGAILNISSGGSMANIVKYSQIITNAGGYNAAYSSSKSALNNLTINRAIEEEEKGSGIRVVSICPGWNKMKKNNYRGMVYPEEGCKVMVQAILEKEGSWRRHRMCLHPEYDYFHGVPRITRAWVGSCKIAAAEEARTKFASEIHASSSVVPVQLDITDAASIKNAHTFIASYLRIRTALASTFWSTSLNATNMTGYSEVDTDPKNRCKVVKEALAKEGKSAVYLHKDGEYLPLVNGTIERYDLDESTFDVRLGARHK